MGNGTNNGDVSPSSSRLRSPMSFSSGVSSSLGMFSQITELEDESVIGSDIKLTNSSREPQVYPYGSWNDSSHFPDNFSVLKRDLDYDGKLFSGTLVNFVTQTHSSTRPEISTWVFFLFTLTKMFGS